MSDYIIGDSHYDANDSSNLGLIEDNHEISTTVIEK